MITIVIGFVITPLTDHKAFFGWYLRRYADYSILYGSLGAAIALLVWMYMISLIILVGAEFNAMLYPRAQLGRELNAVAIPKTAE